jgi:diguanylate cyclase (GGDEF)-like protein
VLYLDLDGFKQVNDTVGHEVGDLLLVQFGALLRRCVLDCDVVARLGGDEFVALLTGVQCGDLATGVAQRILTELTEPFHVAGRSVYVRASIGIAVSSAGADSASVLMHQADLAMFHAKRHFSHGWQLYVDGLADGSPGTAALEVDLRAAVRGDQLRVWYQPVVALDSGVLTGLEALVRWEHPTRGWLPPAMFVPLAEARGLIGDIGRRVLQDACAQVAIWQRRLPRGQRLSLSVNLSPRELESDSLVDRVLATISRTGFDPIDLVLEVTESALVDDSAIPRLAALGDHGVRIALDDFGTGYSSMRHLTRLPIHVVKLDKCFVAELNGTKEGAAVAEAVVRLSEVLKLDTVAEGIENGAQVDELLRLGYRTGQGYHFAKPLRAEGVEALIDQWAGSGHHATSARTADPPAAATSALPTSAC